MDNKDLVIRICEEFEDFLYERSIMIPNEDRNGEPDEASIYGSDWDDILERVEKIINMR